MIGIEYREYRHEDSEGYNRIHDQEWRHIPEAFWHEWSHRKDTTMSVALIEGKVVGGIPFHIRRIRIGEGATIEAAFEYSVVVDKDHRGKGIGTGMMDAAKRFLVDRCDAMMVYRGGETTKGYNFYAKNGHFDVTYIRKRTLANPKARQSRADVGSIEELFKDEDEVLGIFHSAYDPYGGYPERCKGYWKEATNSLIYQEIPHEPFKFLHLRDTKGRLRGYAIVGRQEGSKEYTILELATNRGDLSIARELVLAACDLAASKGCAVSTFCQDTSHYASIYGQIGFSCTKRCEESEMIMVYPLMPERLVRKAWRGSPALKETKVVAWTPTRKVVLNDPESPRKTVTLEMKDDIFTRLLLRRIDIVNAVRCEYMTMVGGSSKDLRAIASSLPYTGWEYHHIDFI
jgi:GNAT superfamily N-acetyltransferase